MGCNVNISVWAANNEGHPLKRINKLTVQMEAFCLALNCFSGLECRNSIAWVKPHRSYETRMQLRPERAQCSFRFLLSPMTVLYFTGLKGGNPIARGEAP